MRHDVIVVGAGLAGMTAAKKLQDGGVDVLVLEARSRPGGRVLQRELGDGRIVQLGGEVIGPHHTSYIALVEELGLSLESSFTEIPGSDTHIIDGDRYVIDHFGWLSPRDQDIYRLCDEEFGKLAATVNPEDPWSHPDVGKLDKLSVADWLRAVGATPAVIRARTLAMAALAAESPETTSLLADLRKESTAPTPRFYDYPTWESLRVAEGSGSVAARLAQALTWRVRYESPVAKIAISTNGCTVMTHAGEFFECDAVISAVPSGPFRDLHIEGVSAARMASMYAIRHAIVSKIVTVYTDSFWEANGQNGSSYNETAHFGGTWSQRNGILSALVPPERHASFLATPAHLLQGELLSSVAQAFGPASLQPQEMFVKKWGVDPWTQGYITAWRPGDVTRVGPLHATHEPPFYVCGSDQWVCGYMEGAVRSGRSAARALLGPGTDNDEP
jgi:monoamine oxidase